MVVWGLLVVACTHRTETDTRRAFEDAARGEAERPSGDATGTSERQPGAGVVQGWPRVDSILRQAHEVLGSADPEEMARLASRWCATEPKPQQTESGPVWVCFPEPPVQAGGHGFTLELGDEGVVGLVSSSLSGTESQQLVNEALDGIERWCTAPWQPVKNHKPDSHEDFHTCPVEGGSVLAVGRVPRDFAADLWQVSVTMLAST